MIKLYCKILAIGIIVLFIGTGIYPAFANTTNTPSSDNENPITKTSEIYENTNCFIIGSVDEAFNGIHFYGYGDIVFGFKFDGEFHHSEGWIYTNGCNGKWQYNSILKGGFLGDVSSYDAQDWWSGLLVTYYVGVEGFKGLAFGGHPRQEPIEDPRGAPCWFIGRADHVKISI